MPTDVFHGFFWQKIGSLFSLKIAGIPRSTQQKIHAQSQQLIQDVSYFPSLKARKISERCRWLCSDVITANFERISHFALVFLVLTLTFVAEYIKLEKNYYCFIFAFKNVICFCQFLITSSARLSSLI